MFDARKRLPKRCPQACLRSKSGGCRQGPGNTSLTSCDGADRARFPGDGGWPSKNAMVQPLTMYWRTGR